MSEWKEYRLADFSEINPTERLPKGTIAKKIAMENVQPFTKKIPTYSNEEYKGGVKFKNGDTIMARITPSLENGKTSYVDIFDDGEIGFGSTEFIVFRKKQNVSDKHFVYYLTTSPIIRNTAIKSMTGSSGRQRVQTDVVKDHLFDAPELPEQKAIASVLSSLDDKIDLLHRQNKTLEAMAETLFRQWFVEPVRRGGEADDGWEVRPLGALVTVKRGGSPRPIQDYLSDTGLRWLKISDATKESSPFIFEIKEYIKEEGLKKTTHLQKGNIVLSNSATPGIPKILQVDTCIHDGWLHFPKSYFSNEFLYVLFKKIRPELLQQGNGSIFTNLKTDILKEYPIPIADDKSLLQFDDQVKPMFNKLLGNAIQIRTLEKLRDTLLPKLMSGEVHCSEFTKSS